MTGPDGILSHYSTIADHRKRQKRNYQYSYQGPVHHVVGDVENVISLGSNSFPTNVVSC